MGLLLLGLTHCGGEVKREPKEDSDPLPGQAEPGDPSDSDVGPGTDVLGKCEAGFDRYEEPDRDCNWVVNGLCYEEKLDACACACPGGTAVTTCSSGFPQRNGRVPVYCS